MVIGEKSCFLPILGTLPMAREFWSQQVNERATNREIRDSSFTFKGLRDVSYWRYFQILSIND